MYSTFMIVVSPLAIIPASIIVTHALRSHDETIAPLRCVFPNMSASCGFMIAICHRIFSISTSQLSRHSKSTSWTRDTHSACVRRREKGDWRSVGNPGNILVWKLTALSEDLELYTVMISFSSLRSYLTHASRHFVRKNLRSLIRACRISMLGVAVSAPRIMNVPLSI